MSIYNEYLAQEAWDDALEARFEAEAREAEFRFEAEETIQALEDEFRAGLERAADLRDWDLYSDLYKDLYGVRPRW